MPVLETVPINDLKPFYTEGGEAYSSILGTVAGPTSTHAYILPVGTDCAHWQNIPLLTFWQRSRRKFKNVEHCRKLVSKSDMTEESIIKK